MNRGYLADQFAGVGVKRLSAVEAEPRVSNQHEINTTREMRDTFLGEHHQERFHVVYLRFEEDGAAIRVDGTATHYDARLNTPGRTEWRLYYPSNLVTETMREGDTLFLAKDRSGTLHFIVAPEGSTEEQQLLWLFGTRPAGMSFVTRGFGDDRRELDFTTRLILESIGIGPEGAEPEELDSIVDGFGMTFPPTRDLSSAAQKSLPDVRAEDNPDVTLLAWLEREEDIFRRQERLVVAARLEQGFTGEHGADVDGFITYSLSVQNRRKARMGLSLENHLETIFQAWGIAHERGVVTENRHKPDFLFPNLAAYRRAPATGHPELAMLGAKSSCKERWRQVLVEAKKIPTKHLVTLEPGISEAQTMQMQDAELQLVVPAQIQSTYSIAQQDWLWSLADFIDEMKKRQRKS